MTRLTQPSLLVSAQPMSLYLDFSSDGKPSSIARDLPGGGSAYDGDSNGWMPAGGLFYVHPVSDRLALGLALAGYFGLSLDYQDDWVGRYYVQEADLQAMSIQPAVAWKVNDQWSFGAGIAAVYGMFEDKVAINRVLDDIPSDGQLKLKDEDWSVQFNLGLLYEPVPGTRLGLTYLSEADLDFEDTPDFSGFGSILEDRLSQRGRKIDLGVTMPQTIMFSIYHDVNERLSLMGNLGWQDWSEFGKIDIGISGGELNPSITTDLDYDDTWHVAFGMQYRVSEPWLLSAGIAYDSAMLDEDQLSPSLPVGETWRFGLGGQYAWSKNVTLGMAYELAWVGDLDMDVERGPLAGRVSGTYENVAIHFIALNAEWRF